jgi:hypothetical protein
MARDDARDAIATEQGWKGSSLHGAAQSRLRGEPDATPLRNRLARASSV